MPSPAFGANVLASASTESLKSTFGIYKPGDRHRALNIGVFPVPSTSHTHLRPMTAARLDTNHSMFIKRTLRVKRTEISCPLLGQREDLLSHGSKTMAWERGGWPGTGAWRQKQFCWSQVQSIGHRTWWVCEHVLIFPNVCSCWLGF